MGKHRRKLSGRSRLVAGLSATAISVLVMASMALTPTNIAPIASDDQDRIRNACIARLEDPTQPLTPTVEQWLKDCRDAFLLPSESPSPSPSESDSPPPSVSPTPSPSISPSPSPSLSPSPSPSVSPSPTPQLNCMARPSVCGYPDETNTGVPAGALLTTRSGDQHLRTPGLYTNIHFTGCVFIEANDITIRNSKITGDCWQSIKTTVSPNGVKNLLVEDTEIVLSATKNGAYGICCTNYIMNRVWIHGSPAGNAGADCVYTNTNVIVQNSFCEVGPAGPGSCYGNPTCTSAHTDGMTSDGGTNVALIHVTIRNPNRQTSAVLVSTNSGSITNFTIRDSLMAGGGYTVYCGTDSGGVDPGMVFVNNRIARDWNGSALGYYPNGGFFGWTIHCRTSEGVTVSGNIWDDSGAPLPQR